MRPTRRDEAQERERERLNDSGSKEWEVEGRRRPGGGDMDSRGRVDGGRLLEEKKGAEKASTGTGKGGGGWRVGAGLPSWGR
jgi:hypothetical protein